MTVQMYHIPSESITEIMSSKESHFDCWEPFDTLLSTQALILIRITVNSKEVNQRRERLGSLRVFGAQFLAVLEID